MGFLTLIANIGKQAITKNLAGGAGAVSGGGGGGFMQGLLGGGKGKKMVDNAIKGANEARKRGAKELKALTGIQLTSSSLLRQSQIFTGFLGALFQILGAMVDVLLAPIAPILFKALGWVARNGIPFVQRHAPVILGVLTAIGLAIAGIIGWPVALIAAASWIIANFSDEIKEFFTKVWSNITTAVTTAWNGFLEFFKGLSDTINPVEWIKNAWSWLGKSTNWWSGPLHKFTELWKDITEFAGKIKDKIVDIWNENITPFFDGLWTTITGWWNTIELKAADLWKFITELPQKIKDKVEEIWKTISAWWENTIKPIFSPILSWFSNTLQTGWTNLVNFISAIGKGIALVAKTIIQFVVEKFVAVIDWLKGFPTTLANGIKDLWNGITEFFGGVLDPVINFFKNIFVKIWENVQSVLEFFNRGDFLKIGKGKLGTQIGTIKDIIKDINKPPEKPVQVILTQTIGGANGTTTTNQDSWVASRNSLDNELTAIELAFESGTTETAPVAR